MMTRVPAETIQKTFAPLLGPRFVAMTQLCANAAAQLNRYDPARLPLSEVSKLVWDSIFGDLFDLLGERMLLQLENGTLLKIRLQDVDVLADEAMGALLRQIPPAEMPLDALRRHAMDSGSIAAIRLLMERYDRVLPLAEREVLERILRENPRP